MVNGMNAVDPEATVDVVCTALRDCLAEGHDVHAPGLGTFCIVHTASYTESLKGGGLTIVPPARNVRFDPHAEWREDSAILLERRVAERLELDADMSAPLIREVCGFIARQAERESRLAIAGLGTFAREKDALSFEPDAILAAAVQAYYTQLEPVRLEASPQRAKNRKVIQGVALTTFVAGGVAAALWFGLSPRGESPPHVPETETSSPQAMAEPAASEKPAAVEPQPDESPVPTIDINAGGYTLVAASFENRAAAVSVADNYRTRLFADNVAVGVLETNTNGSVRYRVAIGQVPTVDDAVELKSRLSGLPDDTWVVRITSHH